ncbi:MAG: hypothetical protein QM790_01680 [Nibricoccus sp.]
MAAFFTALLMLGVFLAALCHRQGNSAFLHMVVARTDADSHAFEAEWKKWRQLQFHISLGLVALVCGLTQLL